MEKITSPQNPQIKKIIKLRKASARRKEDLVVIEGHHEILLAHEAGLKPEALFVANELQKEKELPSWKKNIETYLLDKEIFQKISIRENPDGFLCIAKPKQLELQNIELGENPYIVVLEGVEKPGNLGAILRTADAAGVDAVIISDPKTDIYNPNTIRASLGTVFTNKIARASNEDTVKWLKHNKINILATTPSANKNYTETDMSGAIAIVVGTEHEGLSDVWLKEANIKVKIPMKGKIDSLNASVSTALVVYEALRQRK